MQFNYTKNPSEILLTRTQAAEYLGCKVSTLAIWKCTKRYNLPYVKIGKNVRYRLSDLKEFIEQNIVE
ncbi:Helix-turn-helix domain protein [Rickettsiales bacterium Ac37b]|nr:Helix-turn-helix domain protein [Rickettsiales bacterium Ac37b]